MSITVLLIAIPQPKKLHLFTNAGEGRPNRFSDYLHYNYVFHTLLHQPVFYI